MKTTAANKTLATKIRGAAEATERSEGEGRSGGYSCCRVYFVAGAKASDEYALTFGFDEATPRDASGRASQNSHELWNLPTVAEVAHMRVLLLGFAAAMAETGDLL